MASLRRLRGLVFAMLAALAVSWGAPARAQTADEYADEWTEARRGDRDWMQRATEQLTTGVTERVMGRPPTGPMNEAVNYIDTAIEDLWRATKDPCLAAALNQADSQTNATGRQTVMAGAFDMLTSALGGAASGNDVRRFLGQRLFNQIKDKLQEQAFERFKEEMREAMKRGLPDYWSDSNNSAACNVEYRGVWNRATERYEFLIAGDCNCNLMPCGPHIGGQVPLRRWAVEGWGTIVPVIEQGPQGQKTVRFSVGRPQISATAECCGQNDQRRYRIHPAQGAGNSWVGAVRQPQTTPQPPRRPQTGSEPPPGGTGRTGTTPRPTRPARVDIPVIPDGSLSDDQIADLEQRAFTAEELAQSERQRAEARVVELERSGATGTALDEAKAAAAAAADTHRRARAAREELQRRVTEQANQQSSLPADPGLQIILGEHNRLRAAYRVPSLRWDPALAAAAQAYAQHLARTGRLAHAPREGRGAARENLSQGMLGWGPREMLGNWLREERLFRAGTYPNVTTTGRWEDVSHFTQMIWPKTKSLGCGLAVGSGHRWLVCRYLPGGNRDGDYVGPAGGGLRQDAGTNPAPTQPQGPPPPPPLPTARDPAPGGDEAKHPLVGFANGAFNAFTEAWRNGDRAEQERELAKMRYALDQLRKRLKAARKAGPYSAVDPARVEQQVKELERMLETAQARYEGRGEFG